MTTLRKRRGRRWGAKISQCEFGLSSKVIAAPTAGALLADSLSGNDPIETEDQGFIMARKNPSILD